MTSIDLNCDLGEYDYLDEGGRDAAIMPFISSCNVACGQHAGNSAVIEHTVSLALANQVNVGAHPSYPDREHFGREVMNLPRTELQSIFLEQIITVNDAVKQQQGRMTHVKPHGALYNQAAKDKKLSMMLIETVVDFDPGLMFYGLAHSDTAWAAEQVGIKFVAEGFADRGYTADKTLQPRNLPGALISHPEEMLHRIIAMLQTGQIFAITGEAIQLAIETVCIHGDHPNAEQTAQFLNQGLKQAGFSVQPPKPAG